MNNAQLDVEEVQVAEPKALTLRKSIPLYLFVILFFTSYIGGIATISQYIQDRVIYENNLQIDVKNYQFENYCVVNKSNPVYISKDKLEQRSSTIFFNSRLCSGLPNILVVFAYGALTDLYGRRTVLFITTGGLLLSTIIETIFVNKILPYYVEYIAAFINGISGSAASTTATITTLIAECCPQKKRMLLFFSIFEGSMALGHTVGNRVADALIQKIHYRHTMIVFIAFTAVAFICLFFIREPEKERNTNNETAQGSHISRILKNIHALLLFSKKRTVCLLLMLGALILCTFVKMGNSDVTKLYLMHLPFCWTKSHIGTYNTVSIIGTIIGAIAAVIIIKGRLTVHSYILLSFVSGILMYFLKALSSHFAAPHCNPVIIIAAVCGIFIALTIIIMRFLSARMTADHELGALYGLLAISDAISNNFGSTLMTKIFNATTSIALGFVFYMAAGFLFFGLGLMTIFRIITRGSQNTEN